MKKSRIAIVLTTLLISTSLYAAEVTVDTSKMIEQVQQNLMGQLAALQKQLTDNTTSQVTQLQSMISTSNKANSDSLVAVQASIKGSHDTLQKAIDDLQKQMVQANALTAQNIQAIVAANKQSNDAMQAQINKINEQVQKLSAKVGV